MSAQYSFLDEVFALKDKLEHQDKELTRLRELEDRLDEQRTMRTAEVRHYCDAPLDLSSTWRWVVDPVVLRNSRNPALLFVAHASRCGAVSAPYEVCKQFRRGLNEIWTEIQA